MTAYYIAIVLLMVVLGWLLWSGKRRPLLTVPVYAGLSVGLLVCMLQIAGRPKPLWMEYPLPDLLTVITFKFEEPSSIYLLVQDDHKPKLLVLPWDREQAKQILEAAKLAARDETDMIMQLKPGVSPGGTVYPGQPRFYPKPPETLPLKNAPTN